MSARRIVTGSLALLGSIIAALLAGAAPPTQAGSIEPAGILEALVWLDQQAGQVRSAKGDFRVTYQPTSPEELRRLQAFCRQRGYEHRASGYSLSARQAARRSYHSNWWREGAREREEKTYIARPAIVETTVYDGQVVRTFDATPGRACVYLASPETHWNQRSRIAPFAFALEYRSLPHEAILRSAPERSVARRLEGDREQWEVTARHYGDDRLVLRLTYDDRWRLLARDVILTESSSFLELDHERPAVYSRLELSDMRPYADGRGGQIWFPAKALLRYFVGTLPDGSPVQNQAIAVDLSGLEFNIDIPPDRFELKVPEGVPRVDQRQSRYSVTGLSY